MATTNLTGAPERTRTPLSPPMEFETLAGRTVSVSTTPGAYSPYDFVCAGCGFTSYRYAVLPFCRDDAKKHAASCTGDSATAPLPAAAVEALSRLEHALAPAASVLMTFPTAGGGEVTVTANGSGPLPYRWQCTAGHGGDAYATLPACRDDAKAHAVACQGVVAAATARETADRYRVTDEHRRELAAHADTLCGSDFDRMLCDIDEMGHCRTVLAEAGRLDLIGGGR